MAGCFARVAIDSPLPQLDRLFDYIVPEGMPIEPGIRVKVPFGKGGTTLDGFVVELASSSEHATSKIAEVVSLAQVLPSHHYAFLRALADRQAGTLSEVLKLAVPKRSVRAETTWLAGVSGPSGYNGETIDFAGCPKSFAGRNTVLAEPRLLNVHLAGATVAQNQQLNLQGWVALLVASALRTLKQGKSAILVVPDFRDQARVRAAFHQMGLANTLADFDTTQTGSARYTSYLRCLGKDPVVVLGSRGAAFAPVSNLGLLAMWDDSDQSLNEPTAPYVHSREVLLLRQQLTGSNLLFSGHSRSPEVQRLVEMGYLQDLTASFAPPKIAVTDPGLRVDTTSFQAVKQALDANQSVLVQVAATGHSASAYCSKCGERSKCRTCHGPLFINESGGVMCRWCSALNLNFKCLACGGSSLRAGTAGSNRTAAELGKSFPGVKVVEATFEHRVTELKAGKQLVVATPGAEPVVPGGYGAVILLDGQKLLSRDTLRAGEIAVSLWSNAISLLAHGGRAVGVGLASPLGQKLALWDQVGIAANELATRRELDFPPQRRMASIYGPRNAIEPIIDGLTNTLAGASKQNLQILGPLLVETEGVGASTTGAQSWRYLIRFDYSLGEALAKELKSRVLTANSAVKAVSVKSGRTSRAVRLKMDDSQVI